MSDRRVSIFLHSGDYDRLHQGAAIAATAAAAERPVEVFFFWWALSRLVSGGLAQPRFDAQPSDAAAEAAHRFEARAFPTAEALLAAARETGRCRIFACTASMELLGLRPPQVDPFVDSLLGWQGILARTEGVTDRFYL